MVTVKIKLRTDKEKQNEKPIIVQIIYKRKRRRIHTGKSIPEDKWDFNRNLPKQHYKHYQVLKHYLLDIQTTCENAVFELEKAQNLNIDTLAYQVRRIVRGDSTSTLFYEYYESKLQEYIDKGSFKTSSVSRGAFNKLKKFQPKDFPIEDFSYKMINDFDTYMRKTNCGINTISIYMRAIRAVYNKAIKEEVVSPERHPFINYTVKSESTQKRFLTKDQLIEIKTLDLSDKPKIEFVRDIFMFGIYARGMNYIDICKLKCENLVLIEAKENSQHYRINYTRSKTKGKFSIKVTEEMLLILRKHANIKGQTEEYLFPIFKSDSDIKYYTDRLKKFNRKLRLVREKTSIDHNFTSYYMRHSYAMLAKNGGLSINIIKDSMGHSNVKITETYLASFTNEKLDEANEKILNSL